MPRQAALRASDADREQVAERLRRAAGEGRLTAEELEQRLEVALSARTYGELDRVVADLPGALARRRRERRQPGSIRPALVLAVAVPVALAVAVAVVFAVTGVLAGWMLWVGLGWWFFGRHRRRYGGRVGRSWCGCGPWRAGRAPMQPPRGSWV